MPRLFFFFHRSSATHGKVFPQLYHRLGHAPMIDLDDDDHHGDENARAIYQSDVLVIWNGKRGLKLLYMYIRSYDE